MCLFGLFVHSCTPVAVAGLAAAGVAMGWSVVARGSLRASLGLEVGGTSGWGFSCAGVAVGVGLALLYRWHLGSPLVPRRLAWFALLATTIGGAEELLYRGYLFGRLERYGLAVATVGAAAAHAAYKSALFVLPPPGREVDVVFLAVVTFLGGVVFGGMRAVSGSVVPPLVAHACFDLVVYGNLASAPWWVWS